MPFTFLGVHTFPATIYNNFRHVWLVISGLQERRPLAAKKKLELFGGLAYENWNCRPTCSPCGPHNEFLFSNCNSLQVAYVPLHKVQYIHMSISPLALWHSLLLTLWVVLCSVWAIRRVMWCFTRVCVGWLKKVISLKLWRSHCSQLEAIWPDSCEKFKFQINNF